MRYCLLYHGTDKHPPHLVKIHGLPKKGADIDLINHAEQRNSNSAFRGATEHLLFPDNAAGAVLWAGLGGWVYQIENCSGYDVGMLLEGRVPNGKGGYRDPLMKELEIAIYAEVQLALIRKYGVVSEGRGGRPRVSLAFF